MTRSIPTLPKFTEPSKFKKGDEIEIIGSDLNGNSEYIGETAVLKYDNDYNPTLHTYTYSTGISGVQFPESSLKLVDQKVESKEPKFKVGDKVEILNSYGSSLKVGDEYIIDGINSEGNPIIGSFTFHPHCLRLITPAMPVNEKNERENCTIIFAGTHRFLTENEYKEKLGWMPGSYKIYAGKVLNENVEVNDKDIFYYSGLYFNTKNLIPIEQGAGYYTDSDCEKDSETKYKYKLSKQKIIDVQPEFEIKTSRRKRKHIDL